ncbi:MAG: HD-GYP domain-containing protein [Hyphomicrobiales bacterium]
MTLVSVLSVVAVAALWAIQPVEASGDLWAAAVLVPLIVVGRLFPLQVAFRRRMVTDTAPLFAAALLLRPELAAVTVALAIAPAELVSGVRGKQLFMRQVVFNTCQALLGVVAGSLVFQLFAGDLRLPPENSAEAAAIFGAGGAMFIANDVLVFMVVWAQLGLRFQRMVWDYVRGRSDLTYDLALYTAGGGAALAGAVEPLLLLLLVLPLPVVYRAMRNQIALRRQTRDAVIALADIVDERDPYTFGHCKRVAEFSAAICAEMGLSPDLTDEIVLAARVHDVGKVGIRDAVLLKPGSLTPEEYEHIKQHPDIGARLTARFPDFSRGTRYIRHHHERWDGSGYPNGLRGRDIPMGARIIAVADTYDAITSTRVYREGLGDEFARREMAAVAGTQLDPEVVTAWFATRGWAGVEAQARAA